MALNNGLIFSEEFIEKIPFDLIDGIVFIGNNFVRNLSKIKKSPNAIDDLISAHAIMYNYLKNNDIEPGKEPTFNLDVEKLSREVHEYIRPIYNEYLAKQRERRARAKFDDINAKVSSKFGNYIIYEISEDQIGEIQSLINKLREKIIKCEKIEDHHKQRILKKLEKLQAELHKKMTDFDRFYGLVVETNLLYHNYKEAKPIYDLAVKMANIVLESMALANGLPAATLTQLPL